MKKKTIFFYCLSMNEYNFFFIHLSTLVGLVFGSPLFHCCQPPLNISWWRSYFYCICLVEWMDGFTSVHSYLLWFVLVYILNNKLLYSWSYCSSFFIYFFFVNLLTFFIYFYDQITFFLSFFSITFWVREIDQDALQSLQNEVRNCTQAFKKLF